jgi:hypothetical protein
MLNVEYNLKNMQLVITLVCGLVRGPKSNNEVWNYSLKRSRGADGTADQLSRPKNKRTGS